MPPDYPLPPKTNTPQASHYDYYFGEGPPQQMAPPQAPIMPGAEASQYGAQVAAGVQQLAPPANPNPQLQPPPPGYQYEPAVVQYPDVGRDGRPVQAAAPVPPSQYYPAAQPANQVPVQPNAPAPEKITFNLPSSGYPVTMTAEEVARLHAENLEMRPKVQTFDYLDSNPQAARQYLQQLTGGQPVEAAQQPVAGAPTPGADPLAGLGEDYLTEENRPLVEALRSATQQIGTLQGRLDQQDQNLREQADRQHLTEVEQRLESALDAHPYTKGGGPGSNAWTRKAIAELALLDARRYAHEGVTYEQAVHQVANRFEQQRRESINATVAGAVNQPAVLPVVGGAPTMVAPPQQTRPYESGWFGDGLRQAISAAQEATLAAQHQ